jgi:hypothetical protein
MWRDTRLQVREDSWQTGGGRQEVTSTLPPNVAHKPSDSMWVLGNRWCRRRLAHGFFRNLKPKAANTKTMPIFTISRSQNRFLKNSKSTLTTTAINTKM